MEEQVYFPGKEKIGPPDKGAMSEAQKIKMGICPSCSGQLVFQEGCKVCYSCGWGGCS